MLKIPSQRTQKCEVYLLAAEESRRGVFVAVLPELFTCRGPEVKTMEMLTPAWLSGFPREALALLLGIPLSLGVGFSLGVLYERWYQSARLQTISQRFERLFHHVSECLKRTEETCALLHKKMESRPLTSEQQGQLQSLSQKLNSQLQRLLVRTTGNSVSADGTVHSSGKAEPVSREQTKPLKRFRLPVWSRTPHDERTGLPDAVAYEQSLTRLLAAVSPSEVTCGLLFVHLDHYSRHAQRYGVAAADQFVKQAGTQVLRQLRDEDLLCQLSEDLLVALIPGVSRSDLESLAQSARKAIRRFHFSHPETREAVFVTASFGYTLFDRTLVHLPDPLKELEERGQQALRAAQKQGRCQLYEVTASGSSRLIAG